MRNNISKAKDIETANKDINEEYNKINNKRRKWLSKTKSGNGEFDIKYGNRNLTLASMNVTDLKKTGTIGK